MNINRTSVRFTASPERVITQYLFLPGPNRLQSLCDRVAGLSEAEAETLLNETKRSFDNRHRHLETTFQKHFNQTEQYSGKELAFSPTRQLLLGAYLTKEYSTQSAALFNPSIVLHPDQSGLEEGSVRFVMSLRATGEGHISSIEFRTGIIIQSGDIQFDAVSRFATCSEKDGKKLYTKEFVGQRIAYFNHINTHLLGAFPEKFTAQEAEQDLIQLSETGAFEHLPETQHAILEIMDTNYDVVTDGDAPISERVIFPNAKGESMGMEDVRLVKFRDGERTKYYGSYTAYDGKTIKTQLLETADFVRFEVRTLYGKAINDKGMALFPEKINGQYAMITRQGGQHINIMFSDDLYCWDEYQTLLTPQYAWEFVQMGNCGSPIKTERGWLLLTHAVGTMRKYVISAALLDLNDPTKVIGRLKEPLISPLESEREGYVPNVVYTCGWMAHGDLLVVPYAMSDAACGMITASKSALLNELLSSY